MSIIIKGGSNSQLANVDTLGNLQVLSTPAAISSVAAPWTSATGDNTAQLLMSTGGFAAIIVQLNQTNTITGGAVTFEGTYDGINWEPFPAVFVLNPQTYAAIPNPYTLQPNTNESVLLIVGGFQQVRVRLDPVITGTGQVMVYWTLMSSAPFQNSSVSTTGQPTPYRATLVGGNNAGTFVPLAVDGSGNLDVAFGGSIPAGTNLIGSVKVTDGTNFLPTGDSSARSIHTTIDNSSVAVTGTFWQSVQPVELTDAFGNIAQFTPTGEQTVVQPIRLAGTTFSGPAPDPRFWTMTTTGSGSVAQGGGQVALTTGATANSTAYMVSSSIARFIGESLNRFTGVLQMDAPVANNSRIWGAFNGTDGYYFKLNGTTLCAATMKGGVETAVPFSSWNQPNITMPDVTKSTIYRIIYSPNRTWYIINNVPAHLSSFPTAPPANSTHLPLYIGNLNSGGSTTNVSMYSRVATIQRLGHMETQPVYVHVTTAGTYYLKNQAGVLHKIVLNAPTGTLITLYDGVDNTGVVIASIDTPAQANPVTLTYDLNFNVGLTVVTTGTWDVTFIYQ
jgi:hypothetical protein